MKDNIKLEPEKKNIFELLFPNYKSKKKKYSLRENVVRRVIADAYCGGIEEIIQERMMQMRSESEEAKSEEENS